MNRKQGWAVCVAGVALAAVSAHHGSEAGDWFFGAFVPVLILGLVAVFALRSRPTEAARDTRSVVTGALLVLGLALAGRLESAIGSAGSSADEAASNASDAAASASEAESEASDAATSAAEAASTSKEVESAVEQLALDVQGATVYR